MVLQEPLFPGADENWKVNRDAGGRFSRVEMAKVVKERNEYKVSAQPPLQLWQMDSGTITVGRVVMALQPLLRN